MLMLGTLMMMMSTFNLKTMKEMKEMYRMGMMLLLQMMMMLYDSMQLDVMRTGMSLYNNMMVMTSYTKLMELLMFIMTMMYMYMMKEYMYNMKMMNNNEGMMLQGSMLKKNMSNMEGLRGPMELMMLMLLNMLGMMLFMQWNNMMVMFMTLELQSYTLYLMTTMYNKSYNSTKSGLLYFLLGSVGSMLMLLGLVMMYYETGLMNLNDMYLMYNNNNNMMLNNNNMLLSYMFMLLGLFFKMGTAPFHNWLMNMYANTPTMMTLWMSMIGKMSMLTVMYTLMSNSSFMYNNMYNNMLINNNMMYNMPLLLSMMSMLSMMFGAMGGLGQFTIKRMIGYSGLVNTGYFMYIMLSNNNSTLSTYLFNMYQYSMTHMTWFMLMLINGLYYNNYKTLNKLYNNLRPKSSMNVPIEFVKDLYGYMFINPYLGFSYMVVLSSLIGMPPLTGFYAKYYMLLTGINSSYLFIALLLLLSSALTAYYYMFMIKNIIVTNNNNIEWKNFNKVNKLQGSNINMTPLLSMMISMLIMFILSMTMGLDMANNGTHIVESYYINNYV
uniref:NADH-ubiquinone oxidoreductase chain 2 n=1 Tax=Magnusiomyces paraingens TaxID=2606893 RepID=A0A6B9IPX7_9ASCO|nr:NADH dehydrogenase subunit 2 [Saprochaete ingens]